MSSSINERFVEAIAALGKKRTQVAAALGIRDSSLSQICSGKTNPSGQTVKAFCDAYGVRRAWLEDGSGPMLEERSRDEQLAGYVAQMIKGDDAFQRALVEVILTRSTEELDALRRTFEALAEQMGK